MCGKPLCSRHLAEMPASVLIKSVFSASLKRNRSSDHPGTCMRRFSLARASLVVLTILAATMPQLSRAVDAVRPKAPVAPSNIVIGFVGGFVRHDNPHQGPVQFAQQIQRTVPKDTYVRVFENRRRKQAYETILRSAGRQSRRRSFRRGKNSSPYHSLRPQLGSVRGRVAGPRPAARRRSGYADRAGG